MTNSRNTQKDQEISKNILEVEDFYLKNLSEMKKEDLSNLLHCLERKITSDCSHAQFDSHYLFLKLCFKYQDKLPEYCAFFRSSSELAKAFLSLKQSKWFKKKTKEKISFVENVLKKFAEQEKRESEFSQSRSFSSTEKDLLTVFSETLSKTDLPIEKSGENHIKPVEKVKEKSPASLSSQSTVFGKKRKIDEAKIADQSLTKVNEPPSQSDQRAALLNRSLLSVSH